MDDTTNPTAATVTRNADDIGSDIAQRRHEIGVAEARLMMTGHGDELVTAQIRRELSLRNQDDRRHHHATVS